MKRIFEKHETLFCILLIVAYVILNSYSIQNFGMTSLMSVIINTTISLFLIITMILLHVRMNIPWLLIKYWLLYFCYSLVYSCWSLLYFFHWCWCWLYLLFHLGIFAWKCNSQKDKIVAIQSQVSRPDYTGGIVKIPVFPIGNFCMNNCKRI